MFVVGRAVLPTGVNDTPSKDSATLRCRALQGTCMSQMNASCKAIAVYVALSTCLLALSHCGARSSLDVLALSGGVMSSAPDGSTVGGDDGRLDASDTTGSDSGSDACASSTGGLKGATFDGGFWACLASKCASSLMSCDVDCICNDALVAALENIQSMGMSTVMTELAAFAAVDSNAMAVAACLVTNETACAISSAPSCTPEGPGMTNCGPSRSESCCASLEVTGGMYYRTYDSEGMRAADGGPRGLADPAAVSGFRLDKYDVTVGRFRQFVNAWNGGVGYTPPAGSGKHTHLNGGQGLVNSGTEGGYETGWSTSDDANLTPTNGNLACDPGYATWTNTADINENLPINCVNWWESYAFCIWDGGFLPSEAEWEYVAAAGGEQREYPWGSTPPGTANQYAIYACNFPNHANNVGSCVGVANIAPVGTATLGVGLWGQLDLAGTMWQWNLDASAGNYADPCRDCAYLTTASPRVMRGGGFDGIASDLLVPTRNSDASGFRLSELGFRCARSP